MSGFEEEIQPRSVVPLDLVSRTKLLSLSGNRNQFGAVLFTQKTYDAAKNKAKIDIFVHQADHTLKTTQYTRNPIGTSSVSPALAVGLDDLSAIDQLLFLKAGQIHSLPLAGGEGVQISDFPIDVQSFKLFRKPDQSLHVALVLDVYYDKTPAQTAEIDNNKPAAGVSSGIVFDKLMVRHWDTWNVYSKRNHIFVVPVTVKESGLLNISVEHAVDIMFGWETDSPGKAFGLGEEEYSVSPTGDRIAFAARKPEDGTNAQRADMAWSTDVGIYTVSLTTPAPGAPVLVSGADWHGYNAHPSFSPDGTKLAFLSMRRAQYESDQNLLRVMDVASGAISVVGESLGMSFSSIEWSMQGAATIYSMMQVRGVYRIVRVNLQHTGTMTELVSAELLKGDETRQSPVVVPWKHHDGSVGEALYFLESTLQSPNEIVAVALGTPGQSSANLWMPLEAALAELAPRGEGQVPIRLTSGAPGRYQIYNPTPEYSNGDIISARGLTSHYLVGGNNDLVHAWYVPPQGEGFNDTDPSTLANKSVPLLLIIHGGPQGAIMNVFHYRWHLGIFAAMGYGVVAVNFHGSSGYGQAFTDSIRGDWGGKPLEDCMAAVDYALRTYPYLNPERVGALGASYGGYMINWINGQNAGRRFRCLVNHDGLFSLRSMYFTTEELFFTEHEFGLPWGDRLNESDYVRFSPDTFVTNWATPTLVIQGGTDYRVPESESLSTFTALQRRGIPSRMLYFPDEHHWVLKPLNSLKWHATIQEWLKQWLK